MPIYLNIFEYGRNILNRLNVKFEQACVATTKDKYYTKMLETLVSYNDRNSKPFSNEKIRQTVRVKVQTEEEEGDAEYNANNLTMDNYFDQSVGKFASLHRSL